MKKLIAIALLGVGLSACAPSLQQLSQDPATVSVHQQITAPGYSVSTDITRVNSTGTAATANSSGTAVNVPNGATVNSGPAKPVANTTLPPNGSGTTITPSVPVGQ